MAQASPFLKKLGLQARQFVAEEHLRQFAPQGLHILSAESPKNPSGQKVAHFVTERKKLVAQL